MSQSLSAITSFFKNTSATTDVSGALMATAWIYKIVTVIIGIIGLAAAALFLSRIAIDILCIAGRGIDFIDGLAKYGTKKDSDYSSVKTYLQKNIPEIVMVVVLIVFLVTGWIFNLISVVIEGLGVFFNKLSGVDVIGSINALNADAWVENLGVRETSDLKKEYDDVTKTARDYYQNLQGMTDVAKDNPTYIEYKNQYTVAMSKAEKLRDELQNKRTAESSLKLGAGYFSKHLRDGEDGTTYCRPGFIDSDIASKFGASIQCSN